MRCLSCKYDLRKLTEHRCPECGRAFDPNDDRTFLATKAKRLDIADFLIVPVATYLILAWWLLFISDAKYASFVELLLAALILTLFIAPLPTALWCLLLAVRRRQ